MVYPGIRIPFYGPVSNVARYKRQEKRGKLVNTTRAPAFAHSLLVDQNGLGKDDVGTHWTTTGSFYLTRALLKAKEEDSSVIRRLMTQHAIKCLRPASEQDVVKVCHAHLLRTVEEIFSRLDLVPGACTFRSLAEHETTMVKKSEFFRFQRGEGTANIAVRGKASVRPDNLYVLVRNHEDFEPVRFDDPENSGASCGLEIKNRGGVPTQICQRVVQQSDRNFKEKGIDQHKVTPADLEEWESERLDKFTKWTFSGSDKDEEGFGDASSWGQQLAAYAVVHNTRYIIALDCDGLVLAHFHRLKRHPEFKDRWNLGRGAGSSCQMAVFDWEHNECFLPAIVGFILEANQDCLERLRAYEDAPASPMDEDTGLCNWD